MSAGPHLPAPSAPLSADLHSAAPTPGNGLRPVQHQRDRLTFAGDALAAQVGSGAIVAGLMERFGISERQAWLDLRKVRKLWQRIDARAHAFRRSLFIRRCEHLSREAELKGDLAAAIRAHEVLGRVLGIVQPGNTTVAVGVQVGGQGQPVSWVELVRLAERAPRPAELASSTLLLPAPQAQAIATPFQSEGGTEPDAR